MREGGHRLYLRVVLELIEDHPLSEGGARNLGPVWAELWEPPEGEPYVRGFRTRFETGTEGGQRWEREGPRAAFVIADPRDWRVGVDTLPRA